MMVSILILLCCLVSYLVGSLPCGLWVGLWWKGIDIRTLGSKNIGATNVLRVLGPGPGATVMVLDTLKGVAGIVLARALLPHHLTHNDGIWLPILVGFLAIAGHSFSIFLRLKGGKGVSTSLGALLALNWQIGLLALVVWLIFVALTRFVSVGSIMAGASLPFDAYFVLRTHPAERWWMVGLGTLIALLVIVKHRGNLQRLLAGTEAKIGQRAPIPEHISEVS
jgi:glycerol-3-phosphate acyltransferase PlsY